MIVITVRDVMTREVVTISPTTTCDEARALMDAHGIRHLPVVEAGQLVGIVSDHDVRATPLEPHGVADDVMTDPVTVRPGTRVEHAARLMLEARSGSLPVVDGGVLAGIVTYTDLLHAFLRVIETAVEERIAVDFARLR